MSLSFSRFCDQLGAPLHNTAWSWCSVSEDRGMALFTLWEDLIDQDRYPFTTVPRFGETRVKPGRTELIRILNRVVDAGHAAYGIECHAAEPTAMPRVRKSYQSNYLLDLRVIRKGDRFTGLIQERVPVADVIARHNRGRRVARPAIDDIDRFTIGNDDPAYQRAMAGSYERDERVRAAALSRANGICEYCGKPGFEKRDGSRYLEVHHIIALSEQGPDRPHNVIALCADDHRRAHFGLDWQQLNCEFQKLLATFKA